MMRRIFESSFMRFCLFVQPPRRVDYYDVRTAMPCRAYAVVYYRRRVAALLVAHYVSACALCPYAELFGCGGAEGIARAQHLFALGYQHRGELSYRRRLADAVYAHHRVLPTAVELQAVVARFEVLHQYLHQAFPLPCSPWLCCGQSTSGASFQ